MHAGEDGKTNQHKVISNHKVMLIAESKGVGKIDGHLVTMMRNWMLSGTHVLVGGVGEEASSAPVQWGQDGGHTINHCWG